MLKTHRLSRIAVMGARIIVSANPRARQAKENRTIALIILKTAVKSEASAGSS